MKPKNVFTLAFFCMILSGCILKPFKIEIQQGNIITKDMIQQIKPGMTEQQVSFILGTPDIKDPFHPEKWYYVYTDEKDHLPMTETKLIVIFKNGKVAKIEGTYPPPKKIE